MSLVTGDLPDLCYKGGETTVENHRQCPTRPGFMSTVPHPSALGSIGDGLTVGCKPGSRLRFPDLPDQVLSTEVEPDVCLACLSGEPL